MDGETFDSIEAGIGKSAYLQELQETLKRSTYQAMPVKRVEIPKANGDTATPYAILQNILGRLELKLNEEKTQVRDARKERFGFLGFSVCVAKGTLSGKDFPLIEPSDKAMQSIKEAVRFYTRRDMNPVPLDIIVSKLNQTARGWSNYFYYGHGHRKMKKVKYYMEERLRLHLRYRHKLNPSLPPVAQNRSKSAFYIS